MNTVILALILTTMLGGVTAAWAQDAWEPPPSAKAQKNPRANDPRAIEEGKRLAMNNCAPCHGSEFRGNGPAAAALNPKPADWTSKRIQEMPAGAIFWKISQGRGSMPAWKHLPEKDRWALVTYIKSLGH